MKKKTIFYIVIGIGFILGFYWLVRRQRMAKIEGSTPANSATDEATYIKMRDALQSRVKNIGWILEDVKSVVDTNGYLKDGRKVSDEYFINGKMTKAGAFTAVYAINVQSWAGGNKEDVELTNQLYTLFYNFKNNTIVV